MRFILNAIILMCYITCAFGSTATEYITINGKIIDTKNKPVPYIFISNGESLVGTSDLDGNFVLQLSKNAKFPIELVFSSVNYKTKHYKITSKQVRKVSKKNKLTIKLSPKISATKVFAESRSKLDSMRALRNKGESKAVKHVMSDSKMSLEHISAEPEVPFTSKSSALDAVVAEPISIEAMTFDKSAASMSPDRPQNENLAGKLTAGELNDFTKWKLWEDIASNVLVEQQKKWKVFPSERYVAQALNSNNMPLPNTKVTLKDKLGNTIWQSYTDNTGKAELWVKLLNDYLPDFGAPYYVEFLHGKQSETMEALPFNMGITTAKLAITCDNLSPNSGTSDLPAAAALNGTHTPAFVDIDFVIDATGSMGDEIQYLQTELYDVIEKVTQNNPHIDLRTASIFYRDWEDDYLIKKSEFTKDQLSTVDFIKREGSAAGGGDFPEAIEIALYESIENREWRENTLAKIMFLILDAPPHDSENVIMQLQRQIRIAAMKGIRIVPLVCSGIDKNTEYLMRSMALATNGTYVFLTDESGIGSPHIKPTTEENYEVEKLNHILLRIITEYSKAIDCNNDWANFDATIDSLERFTPKPYPNSPTENTTAIDDISTLFKIYPTPSDGELTIELFRDVSHVYLSDITGKMLQNFDVNSSNFKYMNSIKLNDYANGTYFINVYYEGRWYVLKFLLARS